MTKVTRHSEGLPHNRLLPENLIRKLKKLLMASLLLPLTPVQDCCPFPLGQHTGLNLPALSAHFPPLSLGFRHIWSLDGGSINADSGAIFTLKSDSVLVGLSWHARWSRVSKSEAWGPYLCFVSPWLPLLWDVLEEKGMVGNPFVKQIKFMTVTGLLHPARGKKEQLDAEGIKTVGGRNSRFRQQILGDSCPQMI